MTSGNKDKDASYFNQNFLPKLSHLVLSLTLLLRGSDEWLQGMLPWPLTSVSSRKDDAIEALPAIAVNNESELKTAYRSVKVISQSFFF